METKTREVQDERDRENEMYATHLLGGFIDQIIPVDEWGDGYTHVPVTRDDQVIEKVLFYTLSGSPRSYEIDLTPVPKWTRTGFSGAANLARLFAYVTRENERVYLFSPDVARVFWNSFTDEMVDRLTPDLVRQLVDFTEKVAKALKIDVKTLSTGVDYTLLFENPEDMAHPMHPTRRVHVTETNGDNEAYVSTVGLDPHLKHNSYILEAAIQRIGRALA